MQSEERLANWIKKSNKLENYIELFEGWVDKLSNKIEEYIGIDEDDDVAFMEIQHYYEYKIQNFIAEECEPILFFLIDENKELNEANLGRNKSTSRKEQIKKLKQKMKTCLENRSTLWDDIKDQHEELEWELLPKSKLPPKPSRHFENLPDIEDQRAAGGVGEQFNLFL
jgi:hypothetical protein